MSQGWAKLWWLLALVSVRATAAPELVLSGGSDELRDNIRAYLNVESQSCRLARWHVRALGEELDRRMNEAAQALGYYQLQAEKTFDRTENCWRLTLAITPGPVTTYEQVEILLEGEGKENSSLTKLIKDTRLKPGAQLNHGNYESFKTRLLQAASAQGFFDAKLVRSEVLVSQEQNSARVHLILDTKARYRLGDITVTHDILRDSLIDRYVTLEKGQEYRSEDLVKLRSELQASNYFGSVSVKPQLNALDNGEVPIHIDLLKGPKHSYSVGVGYASDIGPRVLLGYENRYLNSRGHSLDATVNASEVITTYQVGYSIPMARPAYEVLRLYTGFTQEDINRSVSNRLATGLNYSRWESSQWLNNFGLSYEEEEYRFGDAPSQTSELIIPVYSTSYSSSTDVQYPRRGWNILLRVKGASDAFVSSTDFAQIYSRVKFILPLGDGRLLFRAEGGVTEVDDFNKLPISQRFFAGGDASVRGYDYKILGPVNEDDVVIGGSRLLTGSVEYDHRVYGDFSLAAFYDEGTAFNKGYLDPYRGVGVGVRWISPVGPVRADIAKALDGDEGWRLHLSVGPDL